MSEKKILFCIGSLVVGGAERLLVALANTLSSRGWCVHVLIIGDPGFFRNELDREVTVHCIKKKCKFDLFLLFRIVKVINRVSPDIINTHLWTANTWVRFSLYFSKYLIVITEHNRDEWKGWIHAYIDRFLIKKTSRAIAVSDDTKQFYVDHILIPSNLVSVIYNGVDVRRFSCGIKDSMRESLSLDSDTFIIGIIGRLVEQKNHYRFIDAVSHLLSSVDGFVCLVVGDGPLMGKLQEYAESLNVSQYIKFLGVRKDIPELLASMDIFTLSSDREGHPLTALEAQAAGVPVVLTDVGGSKYAIATAGVRVGGLLVPPDSFALSAAWEKLFTNKRLREDMSVFAKAYAKEKFDLSRMVTDYENLFFDVLK